VSLDDGQLVRLLADWSPALPGYTLYYADRRHVALKLCALIDFLKEDGHAAVASSAPLVPSAKV
jgi:DNA-binding transcriptional LysR family regulator